MEFCCPSSSIVALVMHHRELLVTLTLYCCLHSVVIFNILFIPTQCALDYVQAIVDKAVTESHCRDDYITHCFLRHATYRDG